MCRNSVGQRPTEGTVQCHAAKGGVSIAKTVQGTGIAKFRNRMPEESVFATSKKFSVVVGLDFSDADGAAFDQSARLMRRVPHGLLHLVHVFDAEPSSARAVDLVEHLRLYVNEKAATEHLGDMTIGIYLRAGNVVRELVQLATDTQADLIVVGSHGRRHLGHWIVGSTAERLIAGAPFPVLVANPVPKVPEKHEPTIEPPCPLCLQARLASHGARWWCERHSARVYGPHTFSYQGELPFEFHDSEVIPTGIDSASVR
jgi:nucleotide-binding universal stress UspA family protein